MSVKRKKADLVIRWHKSFSILAPWRKAKGDKVLDSEVVLTKMKLFNNFHERLLLADDSVSISTMSMSEQDVSDPTKTWALNSHLEDSKCEQPQMESGSDYLSAMFKDAQLPRLYKFESDSGVELPSGTNSPSSPTGSERSFVVHSRESSCDSCSSDPATVPGQLTTYEQNAETKQEEDVVEGSPHRTMDTQTGLPFPLKEHSSAERVDTTDDVDVDQRSEDRHEGGEEVVVGMEEDKAETERTSLDRIRCGDQLPDGGDDRMSNTLELEPSRSSATRDSLEAYMEECCRLSQTEQECSSPLGSGLGYLEHICQLIEKIGQLQETNLQLQRQICILENEGRKTKTKETCILPVLGCCPPDDWLSTSPMVQ